MTTHDAMHRAVATLFRELIDGSAEQASFVLNPGDAGLLRSLDELPAAAASSAPAGGGSTIAAHVDHLRYGLELMNRWSTGEEPFGDADYGASWRRATVSDEQWQRLRDDVRREARSWLEVVGRPRELSDMELTGILASVAHLAYHLGAIRQMNRATQGPRARD